MVSCFIHSGKQEIREFGAATRDLLALAEWLAAGGCQIFSIRYKELDFTVPEFCGYIQRLDEYKLWLEENE